MTRVLLDTRLLIWSLDNTDRLPAHVRDLIEDPNNDVLFSSASIWEIAIKTRLGRIDFAVQPERVATEAIDVGFAELPVGWRAAAAVADLPLHHHDPFDRIIVAQAMTEPAHLYTVDRALARYSALVHLI